MRRLKIAQADLEDEVIFGEIRYPKENPLGKICKRLPYKTHCMANYLNIIHQV